MGINGAGERQRWKLRRSVICVAFCGTSEEGSEFHARFLPHIRSPNRFFRRAASFSPRMKSLEEIALFEHELGKWVRFHPCLSDDVCGEKMLHFCFLFAHTTTSLFCFWLTRSLLFPGEGGRFIGDSRDKQRATRDIGSCVRGSICNFTRPSPIYVT